MLHDDHFNIMILLSRNRVKLLYLLVQDAISVIKNLYSYTATLVQMLIILSKLGAENSIQRLECYTKSVGLGN